MLIRCGRKQGARANRLFQFEAHWMDHPLYPEVVRRAWQQGELDVARALEEVRVDSLEFNKNFFGNIFHGR